MKLLITDGPFTPDSVFVLCVRGAEIVKGYFDSAMQPLVVMKDEKGEYLSFCTTPEKGLMELGKRVSDGRYGQVKVGILEATDEELGVLRSAGYELHDLRKATLADFLEDISLSIRPGSSDVRSIMKRYAAQRPEP